VIKKCFILTFIVLILFQTFSSFGLLIYYHWNKAAITAAHCVNLNSPELMCFGKCYLEEQLEQLQDGSEKVPARTLEKNDIQYVFELVETLFDSSILATKNACLFFYEDYFPQSYSKDIFHPPQFA
jgi:hypothetical protein